jgi:hypothetical protein
VSHAAGTGLLDQDFYHDRSRLLSLQKNAHACAREQRGTDWKEAPNQAVSAFNIVKAQSLAISLSKQLIVLSSCPAARAFHGAKSALAKRIRAECQLVRQEDAPNSV